MKPKLPRSLGPQLLSFQRYPEDFRRPDENRILIKLNTADRALRELMELRGGSRVGEGDGWYQNLLLMPGNDVALWREMGEVIEQLRQGRLRDIGLSAITEDKIERYGPEEIRRACHRALIGRELGREAISGKIVIPAADFT